MSLQVWLPLNGDLRNQGLSGNLAVTTVGTVAYDNAGKIGKCFISGGTSQVTNGINLNSNLVDILNSPNGSSIALWVKPVGNHVHYNGTFISSGNWNATRWSFGVSQNNSQVDVLCQGHNNYITCSVPVNEWTHLVGVFKNGVSKVYKNGQYVGELTGVATTFASDASNTCIGRETYASGYFGFNGRINDVRIYDHALSPKEVEEIAKGLVLHYKLDDRFCEATINLVTGLTAGGQTTVSNNIITTSGTNADTYFTINLSETITNGTQYTISCWADMPAGTAWTFPLGAQSNTTLPFTIKPGYNEKTFTANDISWGTNRIFMDDNGGRVSGVQCKFYNFQLEKKDHATGFAGYGITRTPTTIYDSSGYSYNGGIGGSLKIETTSPRYDVYMTNFGGVNIIARSSPSSEVKTISFWIKTPNKSDQIAFVDNLSGMAFGFYNSGNNILVYYGSGGSTTYPSTDYIVNTWNHICLVKTTLISLYINGVKQTASSYTNNWSNTVANLNIGSRNGGTSLNAASGLSDFRMYVTAFTADQVKELYNTSMSVDSNGNIHARELVEL